MEDPIVGLHAEFVGTYQGNNSIKADNFSYTIKLISPVEDLTSYVNKLVLVKAYFMYVDNSNQINIVLKEMSITETKDPYSVALSEEQRAEFLEAMSQNYLANVSISDGIFGSSTDIDSTGLVTFTYTNENGSEESYQLRNNNGTYQIKEGNSWTTIDEDEYLASAVFFQFQLIDIEKVKYNTLNGLYEISATDLPVEQFVPFFTDSETTYLSYNLMIIDGRFTAVQIVNIYDNYLYADTCMILEKA